MVRDQHLNVWDIGNYYGVINHGIELLVCGMSQADWDSIMEYYPQAKFLNYSHISEVFEQEPDVIDVPDPFYPFSQYFTERFKRTVVVGWENLPGKTLFSRGAQRCLEQAWKCTARSPMARHELKFNGVPNSKIKVIPGAVDTDFFKPDIPVEKRRRAVLFVGRVTQEKGFLDILWALHQSGIPLWVAGASEPPLQYQKWLEQLDVEIEWLGFLNRTELRDLYQRAGVLCVPSIPLVNDTDPFAQWSEQFGQVFIEAMACGCPIVSTNSGAIPWVVKGSNHLVDPRDWPMLLGEIKALLDNPDLRMSASILGRQFAVEFYDQKVIGQRIKEWYEL
jgi:glycosyltransferase involved in cell wall biosynthesis